MMMKLMYILDCLQCNIKKYVHDDVAFIHEFRCIGGKYIERYPKQKSICKGMQNFGYCALSFSF
ncbi:hypothetical protein HanPSC8_Chr05g0204741 [Helianthus annuus]|nr:hypothetical protein HanPSC8_Chr05g0204741 [Helianthus annuus]